jgi:hypothetical protein
MDDILKINGIYKTSDDVIFKEVEGQYIIVPLISGVGNLDDELFQLNSTGSAVWGMLDGKTSLIDIIVCLSKEYDASHEKIQTDVVNIVETLVKKGFVFEVN